MYPFSRVTLGGSTQPPRTTQADLSDYESGTGRGVVLRTGWKASGRKMEKPAPTAVKDHGALKEWN